MSNDQFSYIPEKNPKICYNNFGTKIRYLTVVKFLRLDIEYDCRNKHTVPVSKYFMKSAFQILTEIYLPKIEQKGHVSINILRNIQESPRQMLGLGICDISWDCSLVLDIHYCLGRQYQL